MKKAILLASAAIVAALPLEGCALAAYGLGMATMVEDMKQREREGYARYRQKAARENAALEQRGLKPKPVLSLKRWRESEGS